MMLLPTEMESDLTFEWDLLTVGVLLLTCCLGVGLSFFGFAVRGQVCTLNVTPYLILVCTSIDA